MYDILFSVVRGWGWDVVLKWAIFEDMMTLTAVVMSTASVVKSMRMVHFLFTSTGSHYISQISHFYFLFQDEIFTGRPKQN